MIAIVKSTALLIAVTLPIMLTWTLLVSLTLALFRIQPVAQDSGSIPTAI
jgi:hypothetical protein